MSISNDISADALAGLGCRCALCSGQASFGLSEGWGTAASGQPAAPANVPSYVSALLPTGTPRWGTGAVGTGASVTYRFLETVPASATATDASGFAPMSAAQRTAVRQALAAWAEVANITFSETSDSTASINFGTNRQNGASVGYAYYPSYHFPQAGHVYIANDSASNGNPTPGSYGFKTLLHEIGHAIGLKHPGNYNAGGGSTEGPYLPSAEDNYQYTLMAYNSHPSLGYSGLGTGPALYDIAAIQYLYGANSQTRTGNDTYSFNDAATPFSRAIWDVSGIDTIDASQQTSGVTINLTAGSFSSIGSNGAGELAVGNVAIAYGAIIENAAGGAGNDVLIGNAAVNALNGGAGNDTLAGGASNDTLDGGAGIDTAIFSGNHADYDFARSGGAVVVSHRGGGDGNDTLTNIEYAQFADRRVGLRPPTVAPATVSVAIGTAAQASTLFTATDLDGAAFTVYEFADNTNGGGYFSLGGTQKSSSTTITVTATTLADLRFVGGPAEGTDQVSVRAYNGTLWSDWTTWSVATKPPNQMPTVQGSKSLTFQEGAPATSLGIALPTDADGDALTITLQSLPSGGTLRLLNGTPVGAQSVLTVPDLGGLNFTPSSGFSGNAGAFAYTVSDGKGGTAQQTVSIQVLSLSSQMAAFDPLVYLASNPDLAGIFGTNTDAARQHFIHSGRFEGRGTGSFDPYAYLAVNPDIAGTLGINRTAALTHYIQQGRLEGRSATGFSAKAYLATNPDLISAFGTDEAAALSHYLQYGRYEGRATRFDALAYLAANPDLADAFGTDENGATLHYIQYGRREGRSVSFDAVSYLAANSDLIPALGTSAAAAERHYIQYGRREGRNLRFDAQSYLTANPDVAAVFGSSTNAAAFHYVQYGFAEGRSVTRTRPSSDAYPLSAPVASSFGMLAA